jgi:hypothetical protein
MHALLLCAAGLTACGGGPFVQKAWATTSVELRDPARVALLRGSDTVLPARTADGPSLANDVILKEGTFLTGAAGGARYGVKAERANDGKIVIDWERSALLNGELHPIVPIPIYTRDWTRTAYNSWRSSGSTVDFTDACGPTQIVESVPSPGRASQEACLFTSQAWRSAPVMRLPVCTWLAAQKTRHITVGYVASTSLGPCPTRGSAVTIDMVLETPWDNLVEVRYKLFESLEGDERPQHQVVREEVLYAPPRS